MHTFIFLVLIKNINGRMRAGSSDNRVTRRQGIWKYRGVY